MGTKSEIQAADYRAVQRQREAVSHRSANIRGESTWFPKSDRPAPAALDASGLRTERVTLEITHSESSSAASWAWGNWTIPGQSVRVVEEANDALSIAEPFLQEIEDIRAAGVILNGRVAEITD